MSSYNLYFTKFEYLEFSSFTCFFKNFFLKNNDDFLSLIDFKIILKVLFNLKKLVKERK